MGKTTELLTLLKTGNSDAARKLIAKLRKSGEPWLAECAAACVTWQAYGVG